MVVTFQLRQIDLQPGQCLTLREINWAEFEAILEELGEHRATRVAYYQEALEIRVPSPEHEVDKELIGDMVKILLDELELDWEPYGSTTFKRCLGWAAPTPQADTRGSSTAQRAFRRWVREALAQ
ncbi:hypothetical protein [Nostoc sp. CCY 9925]|uniref:hypothetical protein n=1 Tax=Nostoc sp. CCY 9925 TaxID=3103865 RepID=UPI0039C64B8D